MVRVVRDARVAYDADARVAEVAARCSDADRSKATLGRGAQGPQGHVGPWCARPARHQTACPRL